MTRYIVVVGEGVTDPPLVCDLADRVIHDHVDWLCDQDLDCHRRYGGLSDDEEFVKWSQVKKRHQQRFRRRGDRFITSGPPKPPDYQAMRKLLLLIEAATSDSKEIHGVLVFRDTDNQPQRQQGLQQARDEFMANNDATQSWRAHIALAVAEPKNEAWVLAGFEPQNEREIEALARVQKEIGFAPNHYPERLNASDSNPSAKRSAKGILEALCWGNQDRICACWRDTPLSTLEHRGNAAGLAAFFAEVRRYIATLF